MTGIPPTVVYLLIDEIFDMFKQRLLKVLKFPDNLESLVIFSSFFFFTFEDLAKYLDSKFMIKILVLLQIKDEIHEILHGFFGGMVELFRKEI